MQEKNSILNVYNNVLQKMSLKDIMDKSKQQDFLKILENEAHIEKVKLQAVANAKVEELNEKLESLEKEKKHLERYENIDNVVNLQTSMNGILEHTKNIITIFENLKEE